MHPDQLAVTAATVRELVAEQFPQWRDLPVQALSTSGTVNALFRLGDHLVARFPLRSAEVDTTRRQLEAEAEAARELLGRTRVHDAGAGRDRPAGSRLPAAVVGADLAAGDDRGGA